MTRKRQRQTCPPEVIRFEDLVPRRNIRGGKQHKLLFGRLDSIASGPQETEAPSESK